jgi:hypothetical protein
VSIYVSTTFVDLDRFFSSLIYKHSVGLLGWVIGPYTEENEQNKHTDIHEHTILVYEQEKTIHVLDHAATVIGPNITRISK